MNARTLSKNLTLYAEYWIADDEVTPWNEPGYDHIGSTYDIWLDGTHDMANLCLLEAEYLRGV